MRSATTLARAALLLAALVVVTAVAPVEAGVTTAGIQGLVRDDQGQPLADAEVVLQHQTYGTESRLKTSDKGKFIQIGLKPGPYTVTVTRDGFAPWSQAMHLALAKVTPVEVVLTSASALAPGGEQAAPEFKLGDVKLSQEAAEAYQKAQAALKSGATDEAMAALESLVALEPNMPDPYFELARIERQSGRLDPAAQHLQKGLDLRPTDLTGWLVLGEIEADRNQAEASVTAYRKAAELAPNDPRPYRKLSMALLLGQDFAGAAAAIEKYLALAPDAPDAAQKKQMLEECRSLAAK